MFVHMTVETFIQRLTTILAALAALVAARLLHHPTAQRRLLPLVHILIPSHWDNPFPCRAQRPNTPPSASPPVPTSPEKLA